MWYLEFFGILPKIMRLLISENKDGEGLENEVEVGYNGGKGCTPIGE